MIESNLFKPASLWTGRSFQILCCLGLVLSLSACGETIVDPPPSVSRLQFPLKVGTIVEYSYWYEEGMYTWGTMTARTESRGSRLWEVTSTTGDILTGAITMRVTGKDTVITQKNSTDMVHPGPIDTAVVTADIKTFTVTFTPDSMKVEFWTVIRTGQSTQGSFARVLQPPVDSVRVGGDGFYFPYAVYQDNLGLKRSFYSHSSSGGYVKREMLTFISKRTPG
jgi:hypothetical protein